MDENQKAIRNAIKKAALVIEEKEDNVHIVVDEATRNSPGSPEIPATIFAKITETDIFVADITTINSEKECTRKTPNPNVLIELGYAAATVGWDRVLMVYNKKYGSFPTDLPFDLDKRRVIPFQVDGKNDSSGKGNLAAGIQAGLSNILTTNPPKKRMLSSSAEQRKTHDTQILIRLFGSMDLESMDTFIAELPDRIHNSIFSFAGYLHEVTEPSSFHIYDPTLRDLVNKFDDAWRATLSHGGHYFGSSRGYVSFALDRAADLFFNKNDEKVYNQITKQATKLKKCLKELVRHVRENYEEVDIQALSVEAVKRIVREA
ncbi:MAG: hypothetical protein BGO52_03375 [Sphingobacteriales bacterium 44-61]|nr:MAG: hypothetical protein BGO52_03375 [Sphingobacteriales bacterium 44-61]